MMMIGSVGGALPVDPQSHVFHGTCQLAGRSVLKLEWLKRHGEQLMMSWEDHVVTYQTGERVIHAVLQSAPL